MAAKSGTRTPSVVRSILNILRLKIKHLSWYVCIQNSLLQLQILLLRQFGMFLFLNAPKKLGLTCVIDGVTLSGLQTNDPADDKIKAYETCMGKKFGCIK